MNLKKITAVLLAATLICGLAVSCKSREDTSEETESVTVETAEPIDPELTTDYIEDELTRDRIQTMQATFSELAETSAADFSYTATDGEITVTGYLGNAETVRVPSTIDGNPVVAVADAAFAENTNLKTLYLPDSVKKLGVGILKGCEALTALRTPLMGEDKTETQYLGYLFGATTYTDNPRDVPATLAYLELGGTDKALDDFALFDCNDLVCVTLPDSMTKIGTYSLYNCNSLLAINTEHLTELAEHALDTCSALTVLEFGEGLSSIGFGALEGCVGLRTLTLPFVGGSVNENTYLGYIFGAAVYDFAKGYYPTYLTAVTLLSTCKTLGNYAFYECETLTEMELPETLTSIGIRAFDGCIRLTDITLPDGVTSIGDNAFFGCISLESVAFGASSKLTKIGINAFYDCTALTEITLPQSLKSLPASCFAGCLLLKEIDLGGVTAVGKQAFRNCKSLASISARSDITFDDGNDCAERLLAEK